MDESVVKHLEQPAWLDEPSQMLLATASRLERDGWMQGWYYAQEGRAACMLGHFIRESEAWPKDVHQMAWSRLQAAFPDRLPHPWNDAPGRTKDEVIAKLRAVALGG